MNTHYPNIDYYNAEVYLKESFNTNSELVIFDDEKIDGLIEIEIDNEKYYNLFTLSQLVDEVYGYFSNIHSTDQEIAERIVDYRINDA
ncbi:MAG: hypothetical protein OEW75_01240 [Cyclobacteriaceae bacterium]|nr:hypothetical protein [Cyclobacteriaceae bacterium]